MWVARISRVEAHRVSPANVYLPQNGDYLARLRVSDPQNFSDMAAVLISGDKLEASMGPRFLICFP